MLQGRICLECIKESSWHELTMSHKHGPGQAAFKKKCLFLQWFLKQHWVLISIDHHAWRSHFLYPLLCQAKYLVVCVQSYGSGKITLLKCKIFEMQNCSRLVVHCLVIDLHPSPSHIFTDIALNILLGVKTRGKVGLSMVEIGIPDMYFGEYES